MIKGILDLDKNYLSEKIVSDMAKGNDDFTDLFHNEFKMLTDIGNKYRIRHHEIEITKFRYYDYLFNCCLALITRAIK
ncbi:hypothetical protein EKG37_10410 [Robertmurraya yapensis]|jgi:cephalosporin-C deacetylase-like acetyl esterase|uniref:Uncharacterized protein n=2 Tax=Bacillales TaxID=1385 RepID=A0A3S0LC28_9BACI|nr:hypothetical protein CD30_08100 [Ureibacillus massiliensis 4400831 = CIP 108448 = CCUG 49529]RTR31906.1 hypothetical protein EKG37_10410 [Bacillus yapensis]TKS95919.1 hypothetical protein FAR12_10410 [Bacillus yapensis]BDH63249.1 hypothetical protein MTP04_33790 [Lysinibacillus sp. PLM2]